MNVSKIPAGNAGASRAAPGQSVIGKLRPWQQQKAEATARVKDRATARMKVNAEKQKTLLKFNTTPPADLRATNPKVRAAEVETTRQMGKAFAALAYSDDKLAEKFCGNMTGTMKPAVVRAGREDRYNDWIDKLAKEQVEGMTDAELLAVKSGIDRIDHFSSDDRAEFVTLIGAVRAEYKRRTPDPAHATKALKALGQENLTEALTELKAARGAKSGTFLWKAEMANMDPGDLRRIAATFENVNGQPSTTKQLTWSLAELAQSNLGKEHPEFADAGKDLLAIQIAAREILRDRHRDRVEYKPSGEQHFSEDPEVTSALFAAHGVEKSKAGEYVVTHGWAGVTVDKKIAQRLATINAAPDRPTGALGPMPAAENAMAGIREAMAETAKTAVSPFMRADGTRGYLEGGSSSAPDVSSVRGGPDGSTRVTYHEQFDNPTFMTQGGARSNWSPHKVTVAYDLEIAADGKVKLAAPVRVAYDLKAPTAPALPAGLPPEFPAEPEPPAYEPARNVAFTHLAPARAAPTRNPSPAVRDQTAPLRPAPTRTGIAAAAAEARRKPDVNMARVAQARASVRLTNDALRQATDAAADAKIKASTHSGRVRTTDLQRALHQAAIGAQDAADLAQSEFDAATAKLAEIEADVAQAGQTPPRPARVWTGAADPTVRQQAAATTDVDTAKAALEHSKQQFMNALGARQDARGEEEGSKAAAEIERALVTRDAAQAALIDAQEDVIHIVPKFSPLAVQTPEEKERGVALQRLGLTEGASPANVLKAFTDKLVAARGDHARTAAVTEAYNLLRVRLRRENESPPRTFSSSEFQSSMIFHGGAGTPMFKALHKFNVKSHAAENTQFCMEEESFDDTRFTNKDQDYIGMWTELADAVNVGSSTKMAMESAIASGDAAAMRLAMSAAREEIHTVMAQDVFPRFTLAVNSNSLGLPQIELDALTAYMSELRAEFPNTHNAPAAS